MAFRRNLNVNLEAIQTRRQRSEEEEDKHFLFFLSLFPFTTK
jgi:hypothetical protein